MKSVLELRNISKNYGKVTALTDVSLKLSHGIYALLGPNGSGKTTMMNIIADLLKPTSGNVLYNGSDTKKNKDFLKNLGYMPQYPAMYPTFSVMEFLLYMSELKGLANDNGKEIECLLSRVELSDVYNRKISALSGGMKQRLSLCSAVIGNPEILILDEPTAGLDPKQRVSLKDFVSEISENKTVIWATHIVSDVEDIAKEIIFMKKGIATLMPHSIDEPLEECYLSFFGDVL